VTVHHAMDLIECDMSEIVGISGQSVEISQYQLHFKKLPYYFLLVLFSPYLWNFSVRTSLQKSLINGNTQHRAYKITLYLVSYLIYKVSYS